MSKKLLMIIIPTACVLSFGLMFGVAWLTRPTVTPEEDVDEQTQQVMQQQQQQLGMAQPQMATPAMPAEVKSQKRMMTERQLGDLVNTAKDKIEQYDLKLTALSEQEQRIKMSQETLVKEIGELEALRVEVADAIATLKSERARLEETRIIIEENEKDNIEKVAKAYAAMKNKASPLLVDLCQDTESQDGRQRARTAVKILYHIDDKTQAKIFAEMVKTSPDVAAWLTMELKRVAVETVEN